MLTLQEAIEIAESERKSKVSSAGDCGGKWAFSFEDDKDKIDGVPLFVYKSNGKCEYFCPAEFMYSLADGEITCTSVDLE